MMRTWLFLLTVLMGLSLAGCPTNGGDPPDDGDPPGDEGPFKLRLILKSDIVGSKNMNVWVFAGEMFYTRETAPYQDANHLVLRYTASQELDVTEFLVDKDTRITLVAFDGDRSDFGPGNAAIDDENANEFVMWDGDVTAGESTELGVASFQMDRDREITALYQRMPVVVITQSTENAEGISPGCLALSISVPEWLSFPGDEVVYEDGTVCGLGAPGVILRGQMRTGSTVTMTAVPLEPQPPNLVFQSWTGGDNCGAGPTCTITAGNAEGATLTWAPAGS